MALATTRLVSALAELESRIESMWLLVAAATQPLISLTGFSGFMAKGNKFCVSQFMDS